ncbi:hypothetical protein CCR97_08180 [Rhodoplanes elegans]|uniref:Uncharacterized protein n=1 Tax=Rhodoplanes elegans TaxID=29408 RepID=A0A327KUM3_9BRAD|nr:hypothetical protein [Rhodoplanes elegans]MBK5958096.1 hypothetical protein [Rhodoplanes elegans]MBK5958188.1 hypothetical protein [Rhodoplanes elegans]RAI41971.1 hypothetical protein CH338_01320 [Rhodoplanes elegans]
MTVTLVLWLIVGGVDIAGPGIRMPDLATCQAQAEKFMAIAPPDEAQAYGAACLITLGSRS